MPSIPFIIFSLIAFHSTFFSASSLATELIITGAASWKPFSFINAQGKADGIMVDFWNLYSKYNKVNLKYTLLPWSDSLHFTASNPNVIHGGVGYTHARSQHLLFSNELPLKHYKVNLFVKKELALNNINNINSAYVGTVKGSTKHHFLLDKIPKEKIKAYSTFGELDDAVYRGEIDVFVYDLNSAIYSMYHANKVNAFTPRQLLYSFPLHFAIGKNSNLNLAQIEQGINSIPAEEIKHIYDKWLPAQAKIGLFEKAIKLSLFSSVTIILIIGMLLYHLLLNRRTQELKHAVDALYDSEQKLQEIIQYDALTGVKTRAQFFSQLVERRYSPWPYVIALLDINNLNHINSRYGQDVGDMALKHLVLQIKLNLSSDALYARLGGDEFGIVFELSEGSQVQRVIERMHKSLDLSPLYIDQQRVPVEFSAGIACYPYDHRDPEMLVRIATDRMQLRHVV